MQYIIQTLSINKVFDEIILDVIFTATYYFDKNDQRIKILIDPIL